MTRYEKKMAKSGGVLVLMFDLCSLDVQEKCSEYGLTIPEYGKFYYENLDEALMLENKYNRIVDKIDYRMPEFEYKVIYRLTLKKL